MGVLSVVGIVSIVWFAFCNIYIAFTMTAEEMRDEFIISQCFIGKIFANVYFAPAWFFKVVRFVVVATIK